MPQLTTAPTETVVASGDMIYFNDVSETPDAINQITVDNFFQPPLSIKSTSPILGIGYGTGAGGAVTQATSKSTGVTSNTVTTQITLNAAPLAADTTVSFTLTNSAITATDQIVVTHQSGGTSGSYVVNAFPSGGSAVISVRNITAGSLAEAIVLRVNVYKSVNA